MNRLDDALVDDFEKSAVGLPPILSAHIDASRNVERRLGRGELEGSKNTDDS